MSYKRTRKIKPNKMKGLRKNTAAGMKQESAEVKKQKLTLSYLLLSK
jgi:hypothetical protein